MKEFVATLRCTLATLLLLLTCVCSYDQIRVQRGSHEHCRKNGSMYICASLDDALDIMEHVNHSVTVLLDVSSYQLDREHNITNGYQLHILGEGNGSTITCSVGAGISFNNSMEITLRDVTLLDCGALHVSTSRDFLEKHHFKFLHYHVALYFMLSENITLERVSIENSTGTGLVFFDSTGHNKIENCTFASNLASRNASRNAYGGGIIIEYSSYLPGDAKCVRGHNHNCPRLQDKMSQAQYNFNGCTFRNNVVSTGGIITTHIPHHERGYFSFGTGGGLAVFFRRGASNNTVSICDCHFVQNAARSGGGMYAIFESETSNVINITHSSFDENQCNPRDNLASSYGTGGAVHVTFLHPSTRNQFLLMDSSFRNNSAYYGGAMEVFSKAYNTFPNETDTVWIAQNTFENNSARIGAAIELYRVATQTEGYIAKAQLANNNFTNNGGTYNYHHGAVGKTRGTVNIAFTQVYFLGTTLFKGSQGTALSIFSAVVDFKENAMVSFISCTGGNGGAIFLTGAVSTIYLHNKTEVYFHNNSASAKGGAIYVDQSKEHYTGYSHNCFIRYSLETPPVNITNFTTVVFSGNKAGDGSSNASSSAIFAQSILPCVWAENMTSSLEEDIKQTFCDWPNWDFDGEGCSNQIQTSAATFQTNYSIDLYPGRPQPLSIQVQDELNHTVGNQTIFTAFSTSKEGVQTPLEYISNENIKLSTGPQTGATITLETANTRTIYTTFSATILNCPPGFVLDSETSTCICGKGFSGSVSCNASLFRSFILVGYCMSYSKVKGHPHPLLIVGRCPFTLAADKVAAFNLVNARTPEQLNRQFCGEYQRTGFLCGKCIEGYGISVFSNTFKCVKCNHTRLQSAWNWLKYFAITLGPTTGFFAIVVLLHVSITSGPANGFIFFSQMFTIPLNVLMIQGGWMVSLHNEKHRARVMTNLLAYPYGIWSLDFSDMYDYHTCVSASFKIIDILVLRYISAIYPLILVVIAFVMVELHARNNRLLVCLSKPFCLLCARFRRKWQGKTSIIDAFATFIILSYIKFIRVSITILTPSKVYNDEGHGVALTVNYDNDLPYLSKEHAPYAALAFFVMCTFGALTPLLLVTYPTAPFQRFLNRYNLRAQGLRTFVEAFHGCYKDGRDGSPDRRFFAGVYFVYRIVIFTIFMVSTSYTAMFLSLQVAYTIFLLLIVFLQPYKKPFYNYLDAFFFALCAIIAALISYIYVILATTRRMPFRMFILAYSLNFLPLVYMMAYMLYWVSYKSQWLRNKFSALNWRKMNQPKDDFIGERELVVPETIVENIPDRLTNPQRYEDDSSDEEGCVIPQFASEQAPLVQNGQQRYGTIVITAATY